MNEWTRTPTTRGAFTGRVGKAPRPAPLPAEPATPTRPVRADSGLPGRRSRRRGPSGLRHSPAHRLTEARRRLLPALLTATLALWAGPALAQLPTVSVTHTGSAPVTGGKVQLVEGGTSTTFQVDFEDNFYTTLQAASSYTAIANPSFFAGIVITRDSTAVSWDTSNGAAWRDRSPEFEISFGGSAVNTQYFVAEPGHAYQPSREDRLWFNIPVGGFNYVDPDSFPFTSYPLTFTISAKQDSSPGEQTESISVSFAFYVNGLPSGWSPQFAITDTLAFDLVDHVPDPTGKPTAPANLEAAEGKGAVTLTWDAVDTTGSNTNLVNDLQITRHQVRQATDGNISDETWTDIPDSAYGEVHATTWTVGSLTDGTEYTFQVRALNGCTATPGCGEGDPATAIMATPDTGALAQPTGLVATAGNTQITLTWTDPDDAAIFLYEYQQREGSGPFGPWTDIPGSSAATTSHRLTGLENGVRYSYRIRAWTSATTGPTSDTVTATPQGGAPAAPVITATPRDGGVTLSWPNPVDASLQGYDYQYRVGDEVYRPWQAARERTEEECVHADRRSLCVPPHLDTSGATLQFPVDGLTNGTPHTFRIRAVNADGATISSEAVATPVAGAPARPTGVTTRLNENGRHRILEWDRVADPSILRYEFTTDDGRTWSLLLAVTHSDESSVELPEGEFLSGYTFRIRAVNATGPGPASDPAVEDEGEVATEVRLFSASLEWDETTGKAIVVWDQTEHADLRWWSIRFNPGRHGAGTVSTWNADLPIGTTRYEIPATFSAGETIGVLIYGCASPGCGTYAWQWEIPLLTGAPTVLTGFSATPGDAQITLAWDAPTGSDVTHFEYEVGWDVWSPSDHNDIPDGDDADSDPGNETSHTVTAIYHAHRHPTGDGSPPINGEPYAFRLRAANANGAGPWTEWIRGVMPLPRGAPAAPTGAVRLLSGPPGGGHGHQHGDSPPGVTTWDDPQDPSITGYQRRWNQVWEDLPGTDSTTTGVNWDTGRFGLRAVNANGGGPAVIPTRVFSPTPERPEGVQAAPGNGRVTLTWDDPGDGLYIELYRYTVDDGETWTEIPHSESTVEGQFTRYTIAGLTNGQAYTFAIQAENDSGASPVSAAVTATPQGGPPGSAHGPLGGAGRCRGDAHLGRPGRRQHHPVPGRTGRRGLGRHPGQRRHHHQPYGRQPRQRRRLYLPDPRGERPRWRRRRRPGPRLGRRHRHARLARRPGQPDRGPRRHGGDAHLDGAGQRRRQRRHRLRIHLECGRGHARLDGCPGQRSGRRQRNRVHGAESRQQHHLRLRGAGGERQRAGPAHPGPAGHARASRRAATTGGIPGESGPRAGEARMGATQLQSSGDRLGVPAERGWRRDLGPGLDGDSRQRRRHGRPPGHRPRERHHLRLRGARTAGPDRGTRGAGGGHPGPGRGRRGDRPGEQR